jgi:hypothetical protein
MIHIIFCQLLDTPPNPTRFLSARGRARLPLNQDLGTGEIASPQIVLVFVVVLVLDFSGTSTALAASCVHASYPLGNAFANIDQ